MLLCRTSASKRTMRDFSQDCEIFVKKLANFFQGSFHTRIIMKSRRVLESNVIKAKCYTDEMLSRQVVIKASCNQRRNVIKARCYQGEM